MKRIVLFLILACSLSLVQAQQQVLSFFDQNGTIRLETEELDAAADTLVTVAHRKDDVVWARLVYRLIDLRYKQNYQLFFPKTADDPVYMSLFKLITEAVTDTMPVYMPDRREFKPSFTADNRVNIKSHPEFINEYHIFALPDERGLYKDQDEDGNFNTDQYIVYYDSVQNRMVFNVHSYDDYVKNQIKYLVQEVIFFDKHTSRLHRQIIAIAPLQLFGVMSEDPMEFLQNSITCWILYKDLRPYLARNYIIPLLNETKRVTFDEFFQKRLFTSYLVGEGNMYNRMILNYAKKEDEAKKEQARIEAELLNFEQDLWEY